MTGSSFAPNGSDFDDCCSNAFALTDLCGLRWRKYVHVWSKVLDPSPSGDPVLYSFSSALEQDILCAWRHVPQTSPKSKTDRVNGGKEFWVFWYGDEPNFGGIISTQLAESSTGCWEDGLTHEPRSLLFKALHNLLERCLLSKKFLRLGRWFVKPKITSELSTLNSDQLSYSFSFFVHGESTVCTAVEIQQGPEVRHIVIDDLVTASTKPEGLQVVLSPFGESGVLTGQSHHVDVDKTNKLLDDWSKFYPLDPASDWLSPDSQVIDREVPAMVMVVSNEEVMMYPSAYVLIVCNDDYKDVLASNITALQCTVPPSSVVSLTPPSSPADSSDASKLTASSRLPSLVTPSGQPCVLPKNINSDKKKLTKTLVQDVWKGIGSPKQTASKLSTSKLVPSFVKSDPAPPSTGGEVSLIGQPLWDFEEPFKRISCACTSSSNLSRPKPTLPVRGSFGISRPLPSPNHPLPSPQQQQQQQQQQTQTTMKLKKEKKKTVIPFHQRPLLQPDAPESALKCYAVMATRGVPTVNSLTNDSHKRFSDCAGSFGNTKKYLVPGHSSFAKQPSGLTASKGIPGNKNSTNQIEHKTEGTVTGLVVKSETVSEPSKDIDLGKGLQESSKYKTTKPTQNNICYILPEEPSFVVPNLPGNSLDCRLFQTNLPSPPPIPVPPNDLSKTLFNESVKRPLDVEVETASPPAKRNKKETTAKGGRPRSDSTTSSGRPRGRKNSTLQSPTVPVPTSSFPVKVEESEMDVSMPVLKSPTQARVSRQRRRSSNSSIASPSIPSPAPTEPPKPSRPRQRRQSVRKLQQQQEEKEKQLKEQEEEHLKSSLFNSHDNSMQKFLPSPPTPRQNIPLSKLMTDKDLMVTANDLDQLFDDDDDDDDDAFSKTTVSEGNCGYNSNQGLPSKTADVYNPGQTTTNSGVVASQDLARMFPTPPSLEPIAHSPPCSTGSDYISPGSVKTMTCVIATSPETHPMGAPMMVDGDHDGILSPKELGSVFEIPTVEEYSLSSRFGPVEGLPSQKKYPLKIPDNLVYKPRGQGPLNTETHVEVTQKDDCVVEPDGLDGTSTVILPSPAVGSCLGDLPSISTDSRHYTSLSPLSPTSSISSFSIKPHSAKTTNFPSKLIVDYLQQPSSITNVLTLSDSWKNYFSDKNFDNVNLCSCEDHSLATSEPKSVKHKPLSLRLRDSHYCTCGFLAFEQYKFTKGQGLFPEDEMINTNLSKEKVGSKTSLQVPGAVAEVKQEKTTAPNDAMFNTLVEIVIDQCSSPFSCSTINQQMVVEQQDNSRAIETVPTTKAVTALHGLRQILQEALQKSTSRKTWEQPNGTMVQGPLSWKQFHQIAVQGGEETPQAQPIPSMLVGNAGDWISLAPFSFYFWEKLLLEPFSSKQDVVYVVVAPENDPVITSTKLFFKELSSLYETCRLGQHVPLAKLRDGILRVGQKSLKLCKETVDEWFSQQSNTSEGARIKLYAQVCKYHLAPYLSTLKIDRHLLDRDKTDDKTKSDGERSGFPYSGADGTKTGTIGTPTSDSVGTPSGDDEHESVSDEPPTIVVYLVDPFVNSGSSGGTCSNVGLLRCFAEMIQGLGDGVKNNMVLQVVPLAQVLQVDNLSKSKETSMSFIMQLKCLAFSVFSRCRKTIHLNTSVKSLTGFGPAAGQEATVKDKEGDIISLKLYSCPYILCSPSNPVNEVNESGVEKMVPACQSTLVLHCGYCLSRDQRWLLTVCTDSTGEKIETTAISVQPYLREDGRPHKTSSRAKALAKVLEFCMGVISSSLSSWRLVICKLGRMGRDEIRDWKEILSKTSIDNRESCNACTSLRSDLRPAILGATLLALEPEPAVRLYLAKGLTKANTPLEASHQIPVASVPKPNVSRTYICVFSTSYPCKGSNKAVDNKVVPAPETTQEAVITDTDILLAGADDDESDTDPLRHLFPLLNTSPTLSPVLLGSPMTSPESHLPSSSPLDLVANLTSSTAVTSPFQPIGRASPFQPVSQPVPSPSKSATPQTVRTSPDDESSILQPLAQGYVISTVHPGKLPKSFWLNYPHAETSCPVILRASMFVHNPDLVELANGSLIPNHELRSPLHCDVLKYVLQQFDALSWLNIDPMSSDRRSSLPVHLSMVSQLTEAFIQFIENY